MHATSSTCSSPETPTCDVPSNGVVEISLLPVSTGDTSILLLLLLLLFELLSCSDEYKKNNGTGDTLIL